MELPSTRIAVKDVAGLAVFLFVFSVVIFFFPEMGGYS